MQAILKGRLPKHLLGVAGSVKKKKEKKGKKNYTKSSFSSFMFSNIVSVYSLQ